MENNKNDRNYLTLRRGYYGRRFASVERWFYELIFHKKGHYEVTDETTGEKVKWWSLIGCHTSINCGPKRKLQLLDEYGDELVEIRFKNGESQQIKVGSILTVYGWQYLQNNVYDIISLTTGEVYYHSLY
jgi:hypothetical protein